MPRIRALLVQNLILNREKGKPFCNELRHQIEARLWFVLIIQRLARINRAGGDAVALMDSISFAEGEIPKRLRPEYQPPNPPYELPIHLSLATELVTLFF